VNTNNRLIGDSEFGSNSKKRWKIRMELKYKCRKCGMCCYEIPESPGAKRIPLYPEEVDRLIEIVKRRESKNKKSSKFRVVEDLIFPDALNKKILVITYKILFENPESSCPFYDVNLGCTIHEIKPFSCQAYPLSLKLEDAFNFQISIDPMCRYVVAYYEKLKSFNLEEIKDVFKDEYPKAEKFYRKNKRIMLKIRRLEYENKIKIPRQISMEEFNNALKEWDRLEIRVD